MILSLSIEDQDMDFLHLISMISELEQRIQFHRPRSNKFSPQYSGFYHSKMKMSFYLIQASQLPLIHHLAKQRKCNLFHKSWAILEKLQTNTLKLLAQSCTPNL